MTTVAVGATVGVKVGCRAEVTLIAVVAAVVATVADVIAAPLLPAPQAVSTSIVITTQAHS
jgi:hypothetical protein